MERDILRNPRAVETAIRQATSYATENQVPLTLERVAACVGVSRETVRQYAEKTAFADATERRVCRALRGAYLQCNAALIEVIMTKSNNSGAAMLAKNNFGYGERVENESGTEPVVFVGEEEIAP